MIIIISTVHQVWFPVFDKILPYPGTLVLSMLMGWCIGSFFGFLFIKKK